MQTMREGQKMKIATFSFDDGGSGDREFSQLFDRLELQATFYLSSGQISENCYGVKHRDEIKRIYEKQEVGCHGMTHSRLTTLDEEGVTKEIVTAKKDLEKFFGRDVNLFATPYGASNVTIEIMMKEAGYKFTRSIRHCNFEEVNKTKHQYSMPISFIAQGNEIKGMPLTETVQHLIENETAIHVVSHPWDTPKGKWVAMFENVVQNALEAGYKIMPNSEFFPLTFKAGEEW